MSAPFRSVLFDCDSTLSAMEGIEELATERRAEIAALTDSAMRGALPLEAVYGRRLAIIRPTRQDVDRVGALYVERLVPDARAVIAALATLAIEVRVISGGLRPAVLRVTRELGVPDEHVYAVDIHFDADGQYAGFDEASLLARQGGKPALIESWRDLPRPAMLVGDGATDLEARPAVDRFVAFAGVANRPNVTSRADAVVRAPSLLPVLALAVNGAPGSRAPGIRELVQRGVALLG